MKKISFILIIILSLLIPISLFANTNVQATTNINYTFENDSFFNYTSPVYEDSFNMRDKTTYNGTNVFSATYSFTGETGETGTDITFIDSETSFNGGSEVLNTLDFHDEVLQFQDDITPAEDPIFRHNFNQDTSGIIEWYMRIVDSTKVFYFTFGEDADDIQRFRFIAGNLQYTDITPAWQTIQAFANNEWYHVKFEWRADNGWDFYINGVLVIDDLALENNQVSGIEFFEVKGVNDSNNIIYFDAWGESWDTNYNINDNLVCVLNTEITNTTKEVDKWEFAYSDFPTQYAVESDVFSDWTEVDTGDHVNIVKDHNSLDGNPSYYPDRQIEIDDQVGSSADIGIEREFNVLDGILNITWNLNFTVLDAVSVSKITMEVYSFDDTLIAKIYIRLGDICYYKGSEVIVKHDIITTGEIYDFNLYINSNHNLMVLSFSIDGVHYDNYIIPSLNPSKKGLGKLKFKNYYDPGREMIVYLDNIGVYSNGISLSNEVAFRQIDLDDFVFHAYWYFPEYSLLYLDLEGFIGVYLTDWYFYQGYGNIEQLIPTRQFDGVGETFSIAEQTHDGNDHIYTPKIWLEFYGQIENSTEINVNGIVLTDGSHDYIMTMTSGNIRINESYFYVDSSNRLQYQIYFNDTNTEYIQLKFNVPDIYTDNYTNSFSSFQYGNGYGYYGYEFTDTTVEAFTFSTSYMRKSYYLTNHKTIDQLTILITDNNLFNTGNGYGYIDTITFTYLTNVSFTLTTLSLLSVLIVVILMFVPALLVSLRYEKKYLLPMLLLMTIVSYASALIPVWLMFIFIFGFIGIMFIQKDEVKE